MAFCKLLIALLLLAININVQADIINWQLNGVTFSDGGVATGNFSWDTSTSTVVSYHISVSGGNTNNFIPTVYDSSDPNINGGSSLFATFNYERNLPIPYPDNAIGLTDKSQYAPGKPNAKRLLAMSFATVLSIPVPKNLVFTGTYSPGGSNSESIECFNCNPYRKVTGGYISSVSESALTPIQCLFNSKAKNYPSLFAPAVSSLSTSVWKGYTYSYFKSTFSYLAVSAANNHVYSVDGYDKVHDEGLLSDLLLEAGCPSQPALSPNDCLFNWAEKNYPTLFAPATPSSKVSSIYTYRYYSATNAYLGVSSADNHVYYMGANSKLQDEGALSYWLPLASCQ